MIKKSESLEKQIMQGTTPGSRTRGRLKTAFFNGLDTHWTRHSCILKTRVKWRQLVHSVATVAYLSGRRIAINVVN